MNTLDVVLISGALTLVGSLLSWFLARADKHAAHRAESTTPGVPTVQQIWERQDKMERALGASLVLVGELVEQYDNPKELRLSPSAIRILRETGYMPAELEDILQQGR